MAKQMDVEEKVLAAIMFDAKACTYAFECIKPEHFVNKKHGQLYQEMVNLYEKGESLDIVTLSEHSKLDELIMDIGSQSYTTNHIKSHTNILMDRWYMLKAREKLIQAVKTLDEPTRSPERLRQSCEEIAHFLADRAQDKGLRHLSEIAEDTLKGFEEIKEGKMPGVKTGFYDLDKAGFYLRKGSLTVIAARPGMGKSAFALKIARNSGVNVAIYSLEMANEEQYERFISMETGLSNSHLKKKEVLHDYSNEINAASEKINENKIWINDTPGVSVTTMANQCRRLQAQHGLGLLIVDYLGLTQPDKKYDSRREEVGGIVKAMKVIAMTLGIPVVPLAQLNRKLEERSDKRPILSDLRESGDIEQDVHMAWFLYREKMYDPNCEDPELAELIVRKNRSGPTGTVNLTYKDSLTDFIDYEKPLPKIQDDMPF